MSETTLTEEQLARLYALVAEGNTPFYEKYVHPHDLQAIRDLLASHEAQEKEIERLRESSEMHDAITQELDKKKCSLLCSRCGKAQPATKDQMSLYLTHGWPRCCGETMQLIREAD